MGARRPMAGNRHPYDWLNAAEEGQLVDFLSHLCADAAEISEVVFVGDILDNWICPHDEAPPTFTEILSAHPQVVAAVNALLARGVRLVFLEGNHDMYLTEAELETVFTPSVNLKYYPEFYLNEGVYAVHGHSFDPFNKRVTGGPGNYPGLPLGYFMSRIVATKKAVTNSSRRSLVELIEGFIESLSVNNPLAVAVFDAVLHDANLDENITFLMPDRTVITYAEVRNAFAGSPVSASIADLRPFAKTLAENHKAPNGFKDVGLVVCGHTHDALVGLLEPDGYIGDGTANLPVYANSGTWAGSDDSYKAPTYIEVEPDSGDSKLIFVRRMIWEDGAPHKKGEESFSLPGGNVIWTTPGPN